MLSEYKSGHHSQLLNPPAISNGNSSTYYSDPSINSNNMNGNYNSSLQQQQQQAVNASAAQQQFPNQTYASYYMYNQLPIQATATGSQQQQPQQPQQSQPSQPSQQPQQQYQQQSQATNPVTDQAYAYRYQNGYATGSTTANVAAPQNYSLYQQTIPNQLSQPQPQHYNQLSSSSTTGNVYGSAASSVPPATSVSATNNQSTPIPDTLNPTSTSTVGQFQPPDIRPRVTTTMWEDEKTLCYQVDANNVSVVRRADNNMINGTKLLNVAQMTRGRRDGILKSEKVRHVVKIGSMHLKGVWIPFERALAMAQREGIVDLLYPLFVRDIKRVIQTGATPSTTTGNAVATTSGVPNNAGAAVSAAGGVTATKANSTPTSNSVPTNVNNFYQQYGQQQYGQYSSQVNGNATTAGNPAVSAAANAVGATKSPQQAATTTSSAATAVGDSYQQQLQFQQAAIAQQQQQQQQVYGYQQPYYGAANATASAPNQYYPYNYSAYGSQQPVYSAYGYQQLPPQSHPQQIQQHQLQQQPQQPQQQQTQQPQQQPQLQQSQVPIPSHGQAQTQSSTSSSDPSISSVPTTVTTAEDIGTKKEEK